MLPMELITFLGSTVLAAVLKVWGMKQQAQREQHNMMMQALGAKIDERREIRGIEDKGFQWTRRTIALATVLSVIVLPKVAAILYPYLPVTVGWTEWSPGFWPFKSGSEQLVWHVAKGLVITPLDTHLVSAIAGLYFGGSLAAHRG
jgi:hypothetical protein